MEEHFIEHHLEPSDRNQLELKLGYRVGARDRHHSYVVEMFMFIPRNLGFDEHAYSKEQFYADISALLRFRTPRVQLSELASGAEEWIPAPGGPLDQADPEGQFKHLKCLVCVFRSACQEQIQRAVAQLEALGDQVGDEEDTLSASIERMVGDLEASSARIRALGTRWMEQGRWGLRAADWAVVDEYASLLAEDVCTSILSAMDAHSERASACSIRLGPLRERLLASAAGEYAYRGGRGYKSQVRPGTQNEHIPFEWRVLKRAVNSVLYLDVKGDEGRARLFRDVTGMGAAGLAMLFAVYAAIWAATTFGAVSWPFIAASVGSYIIKDRLKEWGRSFLGRKFGRLVPDRLSKIRDASGKIIGRARETMRVVPPDLIDPVVVALRHTRHPNQVAEHGRPEIVVHYSKEVRVFPGVLELMGSEGLNDIIRLNTSRFRERMAAPSEPYLWPRADLGHVEEVSCARVYHINLVLLMTSTEQKGEQIKSEDLIRIVMDQEGIKRVVFLESRQHGGAP